MLVHDREQNYHSGYLLAYDEMPELRDLAVEHSLDYLSQVDDDLISLLKVSHTKMKLVSII